MSVAIDFDYEPAAVPQGFPAPSRRLRVVGRPGCEQPERLASVTALRRLPERATAAPLRLTRRGVRVVAAAVAVLACALVAVARVSSAGAPSTARPVPAAITVRAGDTLWSIASRLYPQRDPSAEVMQLQRLNDLQGTALMPGQVLHTR
jgi:LysM repeat protein